MTGKQAAIKNSLCNSRGGAEKEWNMGHFKSLMSIDM